jgi:DNA-binding CsgD family transcriptional regulator/tetratricopeptide (TPR) repeat protein
VRHLDLIVAAGEREGIGRRALSAPQALRIFGGWGAYERSSAPEACCAILAEMEARTSEVFVGRAGELGELERALDATRAGTGAAVLVAGQAGIGKTRLTSELARRARAAGFEVLLGRSIDLVGTELPYQPFAEALRPLGEPWQADRQAPGSQLRVFEETLALLTGCAAAAPVLLVLEDLHWADTSTLDLVVFLAHNLGDRPVLLLVTCRADEPSSAGRMRRLAEGVRRSGSALLLELGPLGRDELTALLMAHAGASLPAAMADTIAARSEGNPFFAEELLAASGGQGVELPEALRDLLLQRVARLDHPTQGVLRLAAAAGREVGYPLLRATVELPDGALRDSLRAAVEGGVLVAEPEAGSFRFRHALLAEAIYATILLAGELARSGAAGAAELAPHWAAAGRTAEALAASVEAARQAEAIFGLTEAHAHLERALTLWPAVPDAARLTRLDLAGLCAWTARLASHIGAAPHAVELARRAIELAGAEDPHRAALLHVHLGEYLYETGNDGAALASPERAFALGSLAGGLMMAWRHAESLPISEQAFALARDLGAHEAEVRALTVLGIDLAFLSRGEEGIAYVHQALQLGEEIGDHLGVERAYVNLTDLLMKLGRFRESARMGQAALEVIHRYGIYSALLVSNQIETLLAIGDWDEAERLSAAALRGTTASFSYWLLTIRADVEIGRGELDAARAHLGAASATLPEDHVSGVYDGYLAELALWERRWTDAVAAIQDGLARARRREAAQIRVQMCAKGLRAQAELAALARARRDAGAVRNWLTRARKLIAVARRAAREASALTPSAEGWLAMAEAEYARACALVRPESWSQAAGTWERLERPPLAAYCRWRLAEALVAAGASRTEAAVPLREAHAIAARLGASPLLREIELLAQRARLDLAPPQAAFSEAERGPGEILGLTPREAEVLNLVARGYTNRKIAATLVISVKTASVHVSHILHKLGAPNRLEAAAIAHRLAPPPAGRPDPGA